jgi:glycosyltransferase involved in cell wall biosynthesis
MTISIVIPSFNRCQNLRLMLNALARQTVQTFEVLIADDGSNDGTREMIERAMRHRLWQGRLRWIACGQHTTVRTGRARNIGAANVSADCTFILMLDSDILLQQDAIAQYTQAHARHPHAVILGKVEWLPPLSQDQILGVLRRKGVEALRSFVPQGPPVRREGTFVGPELRLEIKKDIFSDNRDQLQLLQAEWFLTANLGIPIQTFWQVGGFDERMQGYGYQDIEFGMRVQKKGVMCLLFSAINAVHIWHKKESAEQRLIENERNLDYVLRQHGSHPFLETLVNWKYWWHYHTERGGRIVSSAGQLWAINAHGSRRILLSDAKWVQRLGLREEDIVNDTEHQIVVQALFCGEATDVELGVN